MDILTSSTNYATPLTLALGLSTDIPVPGDYDGDGKTDPATYAAATGTWSILQSSTAYATTQVVTLGSLTSVPVPSDIDGDGTTDLVVFDRSTAQWHVLQSSDGFSTPATIAFGSSDDTALPNVAVYTPIRSATRRARAVSRRRQGGPDGLPIVHRQLARAEVQHRRFGPDLLVGAGTDTPVAGDYDGTA